MRKKTEAKNIFKKIRNEKETYKKKNKQLNKV